ncbi:cobalamin-binding protein [Arhodomonas aquaeolei]|uniref:cobalamin-binding protein n=1 Tax=Arhodomonas aquaeolei TaxID=2369 RepID=UPI00035DD41E|nr:cobalamin-binding protein [Arhodomonas aquaeolei]
MRTLLAALFLLHAAAAAAAAAVSAVDDAGRRIELPEPADRIVSLAPHATEILYAAGAGDHVVGAVSYSDWPPAARDLPRVGSYDAVDYERILGLDPDLVVAWRSGNGEETVERLRKLGLTVFVSEPRSLEAIPETVERLGRLAGTPEPARTTAARFRSERDHLAERYSGQPSVSVFFQIWNHPMITVNGEHLISRVIDLCGGRNVFAGLDPLVPRVGTEAVIAADPEVIIAAGRGRERPQWLDDWQQWPSITAVARDNLFNVDPDVIHRASPRILTGAARVCQALETARGRRP